MFDDVMFKLVGGGLLAATVVTYIAYIIWGWAAVAVVAAIALIVVISVIAKNHNKQKEEEEQKAKELREKQLEMEQAEREEKERATRLEAEAEERALRQKQREAVLAQKEQAFLAEVEAIPSVDIKLSAVKYSKRAVREMPEVKFTNITKRTNPLAFTSYVVVDVETTGLPLTSKIVELSAVRFEGYEPVERFSTLINPDKPIPAEASKINHITDDMVANAPKIWEVMPAFQEFVGAAPMVGHNLAFDLQFLYAYGFDLDNPKQRFYDTMQLAKSVLVKANYYYSNDWDVEDYKLGTVCSHYGIYMSNAHRGCSDCLATGKLFEKLAKDKMQ